MDKDVVYIHNGVLLSHKKERSWVICRNVDTPRVCHTEWSKSEREKQIPYISAHLSKMMHARKMHTHFLMHTRKSITKRWTYLQGRNREADTENRLVLTAGGGEGSWIGRLGLAYIHYHMQSRYLVGSYCRVQELSVGLCDNLGGMGVGWKRGSRGRGHMYSYSWFSLLYSRNQHDIVKQLSFNWRFFFLMRKARKFKITIINLLNVYERR